MKKLFSLLILIVAAKVSISADLPTGWKKITSVEGITEYSLPNGLRVLLFPDAAQPTVTVNVTYLVGSRMEGYGETGMAHLLEHMVFKGTPKHPNIPQELTSHGARPNGSTWYDRTNYFETFTSTDENLEWALDLESDRMINSYIAKKDLESEFSVVRNEFESGENDPSGVLMERVMSTAYLWHNYGKSTIGSREDIEKVPIENLQAFYKKFYQPDNAILLVAGKFDEEKTISLINKYFAPIPKPERKLQEPYTVEPIQDGEREVLLRRVGDVQNVSCGYHIMPGSHPDYPSMDVLTEALTSEPSGRLYKELVQTKLASSIYGFAFSLKDPGYMYISAEVLKENSLDKAKNRLLQVLDSTAYIPFTAEETDRAKASLVKNFDLMFNNVSYIGTLMSEFIALGDWRLIFYYRDQLQKVTADDVNRVAKFYLKSSNRTVGMFMPDSKPDRVKTPAAPALDSLLKDLKGKETIVKAEAFEPTPANIDKRTKSASITGGAKYALLNKTTRGNSVTLVGTLRIGSETSLKNKGEISGMTADMLMRGTKNKSFDQINNTLSKLKATMNIGGSGQDVTIRIETVKDSLPKVLALAKEILREPSFDTKEFDTYKAAQIAQIQQQKSEPQSLAFNRLEILTNNYSADDFRCPKTFEQQEAEMNKVTIEDVRKFYNDFYNAEHATIGVVGEMDEASTVQMLNEIFSSWTSKEKYTRAVEKNYDAPGKEEKIITPDKTNAMLAVGLNLNLRDDDAAYPSLVMGNFILGGGFLNSRLSTRIRQKEGLSYGVGSMLTPNSYDKASSFGSYAIYNPDNATKLLAAYKEEISKILKDGVTEAELKDAKSGYLQSRMLGRSNDGALASRLNANLDLGRTMQFSQDIEDKVSKLTPDEIKAALNQWIKPEKFVIVQAGDFK